MTASNTLTLNSGALTATANVDYPVDASVDLPASIVPGSDFTINTGETGYGDLDLSSYLTSPADIALNDTVTASGSGLAVVPSLTPPFTKATTFKFNPPPLTSSLSVDPLARISQT